MYISVIRAKHNILPTPIISSSDNFQFSHTYLYDTYFIVIMIHKEYPIHTIQHNMARKKRKMHGLGKLIYMTVR